jgi:excisionase family DNA binding protein
MTRRIIPLRPNQARRGRPPSGKAPSKKVLLRLYVEEGKSIRDIAEALGVSKDIVCRALKAHGIEARTTVKGLAPSKKDLVRLYASGGKSIREVAEALGVSKDMVYRALKSHGIEARTNVKRSGLRKYSMKVLKEEVQKRGVRGVARELEVSHSALSRFLRAEEEE